MLLLGLFSTGYAHLAADQTKLYLTPSAAQWERECQAGDINTKITGIQAFCEGIREAGNRVLRQDSEYKLKELALLELIEILLAIHGADFSVHQENSVRNLSDLSCALYRLRVFCFEVRDRHIKSFLANMSSSTKTDLRSEILDMKKAMEFIALHRSGQLTEQNILGNYNQLHSEQDIVFEYFPWPDQNGFPPLTGLTVKRVGLSRERIDLLGIYSSDRDRYDNAMKHVVLRRYIKEGFKLEAQLLLLNILRKIGLLHPQASL